MSEDVKKEFTGFKKNLIKRAYYKLEMMWMIAVSKKLIIVSYKDVREGKKLKGTKAICKVAGLDYMSAIGLTDQFITNEKVVLNQHEKMTLKNVIEIYGSMIRVVEDANLRGKAYFDRVNFVVFLDSKRYKTFVILNKPNNVDKLMGFTSKIHLKYA